MLSSLGLSRQPEVYNVGMLYGDRSKEHFSGVLTRSKVTFTVGETIETVLNRVEASQRRALLEAPPEEVVRVGFKLRAVNRPADQQAPPPAAHLEGTASLPPPAAAAAAADLMGGVSPPLEPVPGAGAGEGRAPRASSGDSGTRPGISPVAPRSPASTASTPRGRQFVPAGHHGGNPPPPSSLIPPPSPPPAGQGVAFATPPAWGGPGRRSSLPDTPATIPGGVEGVGGGSPSLLQKGRHASQLDLASVPPPSIGPAGGAGGSSSSPGAMHRSRSMPSMLPPDGDGCWVEVRVWVEVREAAMVELDVSRQNLSSASAPSAATRATLGAALGALDVEEVRRITVGELVPDVWADSMLLKRFVSLKTVNLSYAQIAVIPPAVMTACPSITSLNLSHNRLTALPPALGGMGALKKLTVDHNQLASVPLELRQCGNLEMLSLEFNKITMPLLDFRCMPLLHTLKLEGNPLEYLPELSPAQRLRHLTLAGVSISGNDDASVVEVAVTADKKGAGNSYVYSALGGGAGGNKLGTFFNIIFRRSGCQHPLLASAIARLTEERGNCELIAKEEGAIQQLILMMLSDNLHVVQAACRALGALARDPDVALKLVDGDGLQSMLALLRSHHPAGQKCALRVLSNLAFASEEVAVLLLTEELKGRLRDLCATTDYEVQLLALEAVGTLAFPRRNARGLLAVEGLRALLTRLSGTPAHLAGPGCPRAAIRALAVLGENEEVRRAVGRPPVHGRGLRILSMDGGGMRGLATVQMLRRIEEGTGRRIHDLFDLICGTSTGGILAIALGLRDFSLDDCVNIYTELGRQVFSRPLAREDASWRDNLYSMYKSQAQNLRVVVQGGKHDSVAFEQMVRGMCETEGVDVPLIDTAAWGGPKTFVVATLATVIPARPYLFRNYEHTPSPPPPAAFHGETVGGGTLGGYDPVYAGEGRPGAPFRQHGTSKHYVWQAIRACSAAPYYLADYTFGQDRWQDGAVVANNPTMLAVEECRQLWPDRPIDCIVSIGAGSIPEQPRAKGSSLSSLLDMGSVLIEAACNVERVDEALASLAPLVPGMSYFRFSPLHDACMMELDDIDPESWRKLEVATAEYVDNAKDSFDSCCRLLGERPPIPPRDGGGGGGAQTPAPARKQRGVDGETSLGFRRGLVLLEAPREGPREAANHARAVEAVVADLGGHCASDPPPPLLLGRRAVEAVVADLGGHCARTDIAAELASASPPSPLGAGGGGAEWARRQSDGDSTGGGGGGGSLPASASNTPSKLEGRRSGGAAGGVSWDLSGGSRRVQDLLRSDSARSGIVHLALRGTEQGAVLRWAKDVAAVAEPSGQAADLLASANDSVLAMAAAAALARTGGGGRGGEQGAGSLEDLCLSHPQFEAMGTLHSFLGRHMQVLGGRRVGAFLFERTLPAEHLTAAGVRLMSGGEFRDKLVVCSYVVPGALLAALLDGGARGVVAPRHSYALARSASRLGRTPSNNGRTTPSNTPSKWAGPLSPSRDRKSAGGDGDGGRPPLATSSFTYGSTVAGGAAAEEPPSGGKPAGAAAAAGGEAEGAGGIAGFFSSMFGAKQPSPKGGAAPSASRGCEEPEEAEKSPSPSSPSAPGRAVARSLSRSHTMPSPREAGADGGSGRGGGRGPAPAPQTLVAPPEESLGAFFSAFYTSLLLSGAGAPSALSAAETAAPELEGHFCLVHMGEGELTATGPGGPIGLDF